jgi:thiosulfate reductase cytochrome b subunit
MNHRFRLLLAWFAVLGFLSAVVILRDGAAEQTSAAQAEDQKSAEAQSDAVSSDKAQSSAAEAADENPTDGAPAPDASADSPIEVMLPPLKGSQLIEDDNYCFTCHSEPDLWDEAQKRLFVPRNILEHDVHFTKGVNCHDCHGGDPATRMVNVAHAKENGFAAKLDEVRARCVHCHEPQSKELAAGPHAKAGKNEKGEAIALTCEQCHGGKHHELVSHRDPNSRMFLDHQVKNCGECHAKSHASYLQSVHGKGLTESGLLVTASCSSCHGGHGVFSAKDERSPLHITKVADTCATCHRFIKERLLDSVHGGGKAAGRISDRASPGGTQKQTPTCTHCHQGHDFHDPKSAAFRASLTDRCGNCHEDLSKRYAYSLHGQLSNLGYGPAAKCSDCHGAHDIHALNDVRSKLAGENRVATCAQCHPGSNLNFVKFDPHADHRDPKRSALLYYTFVGMELLLLSVFSFFGLHTLLWFVRSLVHRLRHGAPKRLESGKVAYVRFTTYHRVIHVIVIVSFLGLSLTGLPLKYSAEPWARWLANALGGFESTSFIHRVCALLTVFYFVAHLSWLINKIVECRRAKWKWLRILFGPDSPIPGMRDFRDIFRMFRWFLGLGPKPTFDRWTYWEKFDYWAVFWGVGIIGTSGLVLWFPETFSLVLPGTIINIAKVIHSEEALLATGFIFTIHFFNTHLRAEKFPMDMSMLSGLVTEEELHDERPEFVARMRESGQLEELKAVVPHERRMRAYMLGGFLAVAIGLLLLWGILAGIF